MAPALPLYNNNMLKRKQPSVIQLDIDDESSSNNNNNKFRQGTLFSFFSKKPKVTTTTTTQQSLSQSANTAADATDKNLTQRLPQPPSSSSSSSSSTFSSSTATKVATAAVARNTNNDPLLPRLGTLIEVYWKMDKAWYTAQVVKQQKPSQSKSQRRSSGNNNSPSTIFWLEYLDDGEGEWLDLGTATYRMVNENEHKKKNDHMKDGKSKESPAEDNDEDSEYSNDESESQSHPDENDDDDQWMVTDDEDDNNEQRKQQKIKKKRLPLKVTMEKNYPAASMTHTPVSSRSAVPSPTSFEPSSLLPNRTATKPSLSSFVATNKQTPSFTRVPVTSSRISSTQPPEVTPTDTDKSRFLSPSDSTMRSSTKGSASARNLPTPSSSPSPSSSSSSFSIRTLAKDIAHPAGSHVHNHLRFLQAPRDARGRSPSSTTSSSQYDPRTLQIDFQEWEQVVGSAMTHAVRQWWDLKAQYFDTVLLFKTGKFYELFHMDADVGVRVCGCVYMKGPMAHAGFPEIAYASMADKLVRAGYKVARVEQTETPAQLQERRKNSFSGKAKDKPHVVNREVCSILTSGTRTFCYLEQLDGNAASWEQHADAPGIGSSSTGPLLAICEVPVATSNNEENEEAMDKADYLTSPSALASESDEVRPVCEYGVTLIDAIRGTVTVGQFADDVLRSRMNTLLNVYEPSEILLQGGECGASPVLRSLLRQAQNSRPSLRIEIVQMEEHFPKSTAVDPIIRKQLERGIVHPWDVSETLCELQRRRYYPQASKIQRRHSNDEANVSRWPSVLKAAVQGGAHLLLSSFGAALFYLQRNLIDAEILSLGLVKAYIPPASSTAQEVALSTDINMLSQRQQNDESGEEMDYGRSVSQPSAGGQQIDFTQGMGETKSSVEMTTHLSLDGTTLHNLEILYNSTDYTVTGSLWSIINHTKTPHGSRLLKAWLLRPLFKKYDIDRRADAVQELVLGPAALALSEAQSILSMCGDIERLLTRVHSMSGVFRANAQDDDDQVYTDEDRVHPNERAVLYETATYTKRKVGDFSKLLNSLRVVTRIPEVFQSIDVQSGLLGKIVRSVDQGGCFPNMTEELDWFFDNFDCNLAAKGLFEPTRGVDDAFDEACETIERIEADLKQYKEEMCAVLQPRALAKSSWKYINTKPDSKDKYMIELPVGVAVPNDFIVKGKRGKGTNQVNKYLTPTIEIMVVELEKALAVQKERKARGMQLIFSKFDSMRALWASASTASALLDALGSLAKTSSYQGYNRALILDGELDASCSIRVVQGRHPCVEKSLGPGSFVPNDLILGMRRDDGSTPRVLLLSGVNMGGKSTCLRQTCLITVLAQIGCFVPAEECSILPIDRIYTRLGASDRILLGQSTFFVELAETAAALRGATARSLVIMDELGRGTSTFDGTAIASATIQHLVERAKCLSLFATHYHTLLDEWQDHPNVRLGHMECMVEHGSTTLRGVDAGRFNDDSDGAITFLYTLGEGGCPKSFGINVARLAHLPNEIVLSARQVSAEFEQRLKNQIENTNVDQRHLVLDALRAGKWDELLSLYHL